MTEDRGTVKARQMKDAEDIDFSEQQKNCRGWR
jgi:hypothetical protein